jgi:hypothetical protein
MAHYCPNKRKKHLTAFGVSGEGAQGGAPPSSSLLHPQLLFASSPIFIRKQVLKLPAVAHSSRAAPYFLQAAAARHKYCSTACSVWRCFASLPACSSRAAWSAASLAARSSRATLFGRLLGEIFPSLVHALGGRAQLELHLDCLLQSKGLSNFLGLWMHEQRLSLPAIGFRSHFWAKRYLQAARRRVARSQNAPNVGFIFFRWRRRFCTHIHRRKLIKLAERGGSHGALGVLDRLLEVIEVATATSAGAIYAGSSDL